MTQASTIELVENRESEVVEVPTPLMARWAQYYPATASTDMRNPDTSTTNPSTEDNDT
ncbi:hypothetical protein [Streptomyces erythrochromogenes]|uniref:hypothetical protein n=1 Tax=Streptomyces erythrochromogenes TaxID=285574 RepID=UPI0036FA3FDE